MFDINDFNYWLNSDNVIKVNKGYKTQCTQWKHVYTLSELTDYYKKEYE